MEDPPRWMQGGPKQYQVHLRYGHRDWTVKSEVIPYSHSAVVDSARALCAPAKVRISGIRGHSELEFLWS